VTTVRCVKKSRHSIIEPDDDNCKVDAFKEFYRIIEEIYFTLQEIRKIIEKL